MKLLKWSGVALVGALLLALLVAMVVSAFTTRTIELTATCTKAPCPHTSVRVAVPKAYGTPAAPERTDSESCGVRLRLALGAAPARPPSGEVSRLADGRTLTRTAGAVTLEIPGDDGASLLTGTPVSSCEEARRLGADDLVRAFSDARAEGGSSSENGLLPSVPEP